MEGSNLPGFLPSSSWRVNCPLGRVYAHVIEKPNGGIEDIRLECGKAGTEARAEAQTMGKLASLAIRKGATVSEVTKECNGHSSDRWDAYRYEAQSIGDALGYALTQWHTTRSQVL